MVNKKNQLFILSIMYSVFAFCFVLWQVIGLIVSIENLTNLIVIMIPIIFIIMTTISLWCLTVDKESKAGFILLRIKSILKYIYIVVVSLFFILLLLVIQDCSHSTSSPDEELGMIDKLSVIYPLILLIIFATSYLVFHNIMLSIIKKEQPNKALIMIYIIHNVLSVIILIALTIQNLIAKEGIIFEVINNLYVSGSLIIGYVGFIIVLLLYIAVLIFSSYKLFQKTYRNNEVTNDNIC